MHRFRALSFVPVICWVLVSVNLLVGPVAAMGQETSTLADAPSSSQTQSGPSRLAQYGQQHEPSKNHIFWIIPNYRSDENSEEIKPLTPGAKLKVALDDSFDPSAFLVAGIFAGVAMAQKQYSGSILWKYRGFCQTFCCGTSPNAASICAASRAPRSISRWAWQ